MFDGLVNQICLLCDFQVESHDSLDICNPKESYLSLNARIQMKYYQISLYVLQKGINISIWWEYTNIKC